MDNHTIVESKNFIILDEYSKIEQTEDGYQTEAELERELIADLINQGYEYITDLNSTEKMLNNIRVQLQKLNDVEFLDSEWKRFVTLYLNKPSDNMTDRTRKLHDNHVYDFVFDDGHIKNIHLLDKQNITKNKLQAITQFEQAGTHANRYDVTVLVNGLPLVQIELKKRGVAIREAFNQMHRYSKESFNTENSLFKYLQIFVISNGTDSRYFANTTKRNKNSFDFTMNWAKSDNNIIKDLKDFTATFFQKNTLLNLLITYSVFNVNNTLLIMRPYQIAATERVLWKIKSSYQSKNWSNPKGGGYIWHTTGSGKTLTSFKTSQLVTLLPFIDKVLFVVDRKDLDDQTMKEYKKLSKDSASGSNSTKGLKKNLDSTDNKIIVTTIQKLNNLMRENDLPIYSKQVVFIFDEAHRSQFGEAQKNLQKKFKYYYQFGFTGTPIFPENALGSDTTASVFGCELHSYVITDAIRDEKVLKFKVDYNNVRPQFKNVEQEQDDIKLSFLEGKEALLHPNRIKEIAQYILDNFKQKTHRLTPNGKGFNAMFAVSSVESAKLYYETFKTLQKDHDKKLKIATIFSFAPNEEQSAKGEILDESFEPSMMSLSAKEFLNSAISDYNTMFNSSYSVDSDGFENYYKDIAKRVRGFDGDDNKLPPEEMVDLLIVVGMFLTGFDAPTMNTLFIDKNLRYHGLIQAYSRTNRIYDATKTFGNIITFRDLEQATIDAIKLFGDKNTRNVVLEKSYKEYMNGFLDKQTNETRTGYIDIVANLQEHFPRPEDITKESDKKEFVKLFGEYLKVENILQNYDEFVGLKAFQEIDKNNPIDVEAFKIKHYLSDEDISLMSNINIPSERIIQDYRSTYNDIRDWIRNDKTAKNKNKSTIDWNDVVFEVDLLKSQEINLDYILELIFEHSRNNKDKTVIVDEVRRLIRSSIGNRAKESLVVDFINQTNLDKIIDKSSILDEFYNYAAKIRSQEAHELITSEGLNKDKARNYLSSSLKRGFASEYGTDLDALLPSMSKLKPEYLIKKQTVFQKLSAFVEKFKDLLKSDLS